MWCAVVLGLRLLLLFLVAHTHNSDGCTLINLLCLARIVNKKRQCTSTRSQSFSINEIIVYKKYLRVCRMMSETGGRQDWAELSDETLTADSTVTPTGDPAPSAIAFFGSNLWGVTCVPTSLPWNAWLISDQKAWKKREKNNWKQERDTRLFVARLTH